MNGDEFMILQHILRIFFLIVLTFGIVVLIPQRLNAQWTSIGNIDDVQQNADGLLISAKPAMCQVYVLAPDVVRIRMTTKNSFQPDSSWAVVERELGSREYTWKATDDEIILTTSKLTVKINKAPCRVSFYDAQGKLINQDDRVRGMGWAGTEVAVWKTMPQDEYYFGFGEKAGPLQRKWKAMSMWNTDIPGYDAGTDPLYQTIPFFYGVRKGTTYGIFFDNTYFSFYNMGKESPDQYSFGAIDGELNYYFIYGPTPGEVLQKFSTLVGKMPLPPEWAIGYQQSRWSYYPESRVRELAGTFRSKHIPCDVIYLDIHYMDGYRCFTWDKDRFPNPKKMIDDLAQNGFKLAVIIDPGIKNEQGYWVYDNGIKGDNFVKHPDGKLYTGKVWPGECVFPDFTRRQTREWWGTLFKGLTDAGVRGFWDDMNEPSVFDVPTKTFDLDVVHDDMGMKSDHRKSHNVYGMQMARGTYEGIAKLRPNERPFVLTRANYAGGNRYAAAWTGDNISSWEHLEMAVPMCLNLSISGQPFVGTDIGGFIGSPSSELYARWLQFGVFTPFMRTHTEIGSPDQEPWSYGADFEAINRKSIELRYKLLPYIYTQFFVASQTGIPVMRPLFFDYPDDQATYWNSREFLFGDAFLVAPVLWPGATKRDLRLPAGDWYDYWTGEKVTGPKDVRVDAPIARIPLFVKAGSIIPTQQIVQYTDEGPIDPLTIEIYPGKSSSAQLYEDDGRSFKFTRGEYSLRRLNLTASDSREEFVLSPPLGSFTPQKRSVVLVFNQMNKKPISVELDGVKIAAGSDEQSMGTGQVWLYNEKTKKISVRFQDRFAEQRVRISF